MLALLVLAQVAVTPGAPEGWSLVTYAGIVMAVASLLEVVKKFAPSLVANREKLIAIILVVALGVAAKAVHFGYADVNWFVHVLALIFAGAGAGVVHDNILNLFKTKPPSTGANGEADKKAAP